MMFDKARALRTILAVLLAVIANLSWAAEERKLDGSWVSAWSTAVHTPLPFPGLPLTPTVENQTVRMVIRPTIGGRQLRIRFSNAYGTSAIEIGAAHVALTAQNATIKPETGHPITFNGQASVKVPPGAPMLSDPIEMNVPAFAELSISIYLPHKTTALTTHYWAQHATYISGPGDFTAKADRQIIDRARQHHIRVFGATLTPYDGADYFTADGEAVRQTVNEWIRDSGAFDGVFDFDAAVRDPDHPSRFRDAFQSGDHLHPSELGYKAMAQAINVALLKSFLP
jgi:hypothetical protein